MELSLQELGWRLHVPLLVQRTRNNVQHLHLPFHGMVAIWIINKYTFILGPKFSECYFVAYCPRGAQDRHKIERQKLLLIDWTDLRAGTVKEIITHWMWLMKGNFFALLVFLKVCAASESFMSQYISALQFIAWTVICQLVTLYVIFKKKEE